MSGEVPTNCDSCNWPFGDTKKVIHRCGRCNCYIHTLICFEDFYMKRRWNGDKLYYVACPLCHKHQPWGTGISDPKEIQSAYQHEKQCLLEIIKNSQESK